MKENCEITVIMQQNIYAHIPYFQITESCFFLWLIKKGTNKSTRADGACFISLNLCFPLNSRFS